MRSYSIHTTNLTDLLKSRILLNIFCKRYIIKLNILIQKLFIKRHKGTRKGTRVSECFIFDYKSVGEICNIASLWDGVLIIDISYAWLRKSKIKYNFMEKGVVVCMKTPIRFPNWYPTLHSQKKYYLTQSKCQYDIIVIKIQ